MRISTAVRVGLAAGYVFVSAVLIVLFMLGPSEYSMWPNSMVGSVPAYLFGIAFLLILLGVVIQGAIIDPAIRGFDQPKFSDWFSGPHQDDRLQEYRRLCREHGHSLFWYYAGPAATGIAFALVIVAVILIANR